MNAQLPIEPTPPSVVTTTQTKRRAQDEWCKHRIKIIANRPGLATCKCTVCKLVGFQQYKDAKQYEELQQACKNTRAIDRMLESLKGTGIKPSL